MRRLKLDYAMRGKRRWTDYLVRSDALGIL